jgi:phytoene desaturase
VISVSFSTYKASYWIDLRQKDPEEYKKKKREFSEAIISALDKRFEGLREHIEVVDIATPATYYRYTGNRLGAAQGWMTGRNIMARTPVSCRLPGLEGLYYSGHWSQPGGGLPVAIKSARDTVQVICHDLGIPFSIPG